MPKVVFVNPGVSRKERYGRLSAGGSYMPPLGLAYLAAMCRRAGHEARIVDTEALRYDVLEATEKILGQNPDCVGLTASTLTVFKAAELASSLKIRRPDLPVLIGGAQVSAVPAMTMQRFSGFDIGVVGEGEVTITELLPALEEGRDLSSVKGIVFRDGKALVQTERRPFIDDLDSLPQPAFDLLPDLATSYAPSVFGFRKLPASSLVTSRGCPGECTFCNQGPWGNRYREHGAEYVLDMMRTLYHEYGIRDIAMYDGTFGIRRERLRRLLELLIEQEWDLVWSANARADTLYTDLLPLMKEAGCWSIAFGIESGSQQVLDRIRKGTTPEQVFAALDTTRQSGLVTKGYIMVGTLGETRQTMQETMDFIMRASLDLLTVNHFTPFPGTADYDRADEFGSFDNDWRHLNEHQLVFVPRGLTAGEVERFIRKITRRFYLRPGVLLYALKLALDPRNLKLLAKGLWAFLCFTTERSPGRAVAEDGTSAVSEYDDEAATEREV